ncbi:ABC transporter permease [Microbacterium sp. No. 7]|uniref:ABC transporter permease n=1 Tax=Microbacterium sp. No. 7 TaxID=1714373 RepID=UPI0006CF6116|nr:ABC transporter permease [Microbacterium sp. No. 7]ALJ19306.1 peptide ABC transporter permease [Microbacterium sp. No. 7]
MSDTSTSAAPVVPAAKPVSPQARTWRRFFSKPVGWVTMGILALFFLLGAIGPLFVPYPSGSGPDVLQPPSGAHWFGTDGLGLDVFAQVVWGTRMSLLIAVCAGLIATVLGALLGIMAAYFRRLDPLISAVTDVMLSLPILPLMIVVAALLGPSVLTLTLVIGLFSWPEITRLIRSNALTVVHQPFVDGARAVGASSLRIMWKDVLPMVSPLLIVNGLLTGARAVISEAGLSFLGLGDPNTWSWGRILQSAQRDGVLVYAWWQTLFPSIMILLLVLSATIAGLRFNDSRAVKLSGV